MRVMGLLQDGQNNNGQGRVIHVQEYRSSASSSNSSPSGSRVAPVSSPRSVDPAAAGVSELQNAGHAPHPFGVGSERGSSPGRVMRDGGTTIINSGSPKKSAASSQMAEVTTGSTQLVTSRRGGVDAGAPSSKPCSPTNEIIERDDEQNSDSTPGGQKGSDDATATPSHKCLPSCLASMFCCTSNAKVHHDKIDNFQVSAETKSAELEGPSEAQLEVRCSLFFQTQNSKLNIDH
jgi:hypothetical protein